MSFITINDADEILGNDFAPDGDKATLVKQSNVWMKNEIGFIPDPVDPILKDAACEIIKGILAGDIYSGVERQTTREMVDADGVKVDETFANGSVALSKYEQIAKAYIASLDLTPRGFAFGVYRG
ncbi:hypothetical protein [Acinetobacter rudis]|uniref:Uncharacterized protein n=1 Tax=Acinetobacter rudis CIP 110305 TaxID=421052 RepID=S3NYC6_9GAMM|nr:hypothetical protein [Acinetobacter rudis]EPF71122.1 hypothetical protein F945_02663 [Acinetobacter rudis CIP 110305]EPF71626.1 hypothetical protein F945_02659 [Acinetobacter rudis CIP 110305]